MLVSLFDKASGVFSRRWIMGRRVVLDLSQATEPRIAVVKLPCDGSFHFAIKRISGGAASALVLVSRSGEEVLAEFADPLAAAHALKKIKVGILRPFKKIVLGALGVIVIVMAFDLAAMPRSERLASAPQAGPSSARMGSLAIPGSAAQGFGAPPPAQAPRQSSPEADAAIRMLGGK